MGLFFIQIYVCVTLLIMYATMVSFDVHFDTCFFVIASCILNHLWFSVEVYGHAKHAFVHCLTAVRRIQVCSHTFFLFS